MKLHSKSADEAAAEKENRTDQVNAAIELMKENEKYADDPLLGFFWYDKNNDELFGVTSTPASDCKWYESSQRGAAIRTDRRLLKTYGRKNVSGARTDDSQEIILQRRTEEYLR